MGMQQSDGVEAPAPVSYIPPRAMAHPAFRWDIDPLEADAPSDQVVVTTRRRLLRLSIAATDVGARFASEGMDGDPAAWMIAPRTLFDDLMPIEACQELAGFNRNALLHGLGLGLDADPSEIDELLSDGAPIDIDEVDAGERIVPLAMSRTPRLFTCWVEADGGGTGVIGFCALVTDRPADLVERVVDRFGGEAATFATYHVGFDQAMASASAMISPAMTHTLLLAAADPTSAPGSGLDIVVERRCHT